MQFKFRKKIGNSEIEFTDDAKNHIEFFQKVAFYVSLPETTPSGSSDLEITHRSTNQGYHYYSLVSKSEKLEYKLGQSQKSPGSLYGTDWEALYVGNENSDSQDQPQGLGAPQQQNYSPQSGGLGVPQTQGLGSPQPVQQAPIQQPAPLPTQMQPPVGFTPQATTQPAGLGGLTPPPVTQQPLQQAPVQQATPAINPQVQATANDLMNKWLK